MLIPKKDRLTVYKYLFTEGVMYAKKDGNLPKHPDLDVPNLYVMKLMQSLHARELVKEIYAWRTFYWYLNDEGIEYLREYLSLPAEVGKEQDTITRGRSGRGARPHLLSRRSVGRGGRSSRSRAARSWRRLKHESKVSCSRARRKSLAVAPSTSPWVDCNECFLRPRSFHGMQLGVEWSTDLSDSLRSSLCVCLRASSRDAQEAGEGDHAGQRSARKGGPGWQEVEGAF